MSIGNLDKMHLIFGERIKCIPSLHRKNKSIQKMFLKVHFPQKKSISLYFDIMSCQSINEDLHKIKFKVTTLAGRKR